MQRSADEGSVMTCHPQRRDCGFDGVCKLKSARFALNLLIGNAGDQISSSGSFQLKLKRDEISFWTW